MSIIEKVFKYEATELPVIKYEDEIWFKAVVVATILKYTNQRKAIRDHVDPEDKRKLSELMSKSKRNELLNLKTCLNMKQLNFQSLSTRMRYGSKLLLLPPS